MVKITLKVNPDDIARVNLLLDEIDAKAAMRNALNQTLKNVKSDAANRVYGILNLTKARINENFRIERAITGEVSGAFKSIGKPINLASFRGAIQSDWSGEGDKGLYVKVLRAGREVLLRHGFIWERTSKSGDLARTAFQRAYRGPRTSASRLLPWKKMYPGKPAHERREVETLQGPRIEDILAKPEVIGPIERSGADSLTENINNELERILSKHK